jgi:hypothetical protein
MKKFSHFTLLSLYNSFFFNIHLLYRYIIYMHFLTWLGFGWIEYVANTLYIINISNLYNYVTYLSVI